MATTLLKAVITDWGFPSLDPERQAFAPLGVDVDAHQCKTEEEVAAVVRDADVVLTQWAPVRAKAIASMLHCKGIVRYGIGLDNVDLVAAKKRGIPVRNIPDYCLHEVADHTFALMLSLQRQVCSVDRLVRAGTWKITPPLPLPPLRQSTIGLIGFGRIAQLVAQRAKGFAINVIASDPFAPDNVFSSLGVQRVERADLLKNADIVSLHCPLTDETKHVINAESLTTMKPTALLVNTSRGGLVDTDALVEALGRKQIAGAALDVLEQEPIPAQHTILTFPNVIITSHTAWYSNASIVELQKKAAAAAIELLKTRGTAQ